MKNFSAIILLFIANSISGIAQGISMIAIPWYFAALGEMDQFGAIYIGVSIFSLFWVPYSATFVDRFNRKHIFLAVTAVCGILIFSIASWGFMRGELPWYLVALSFMITFLNYNIHYPNLYAFVQEITEKSLYGKITSYLEIQGQLTGVLAGAGAAFLLEGTTGGTTKFLGLEWHLPFEIAAWEIHEIFMLDAATYVVAFIIISMIRYQPIANRSVELTSIAEQLKVGFQYLKSNPGIFLFGVASYSIFVTVLIEGFYLGAHYTKEHLQEGGDVFASTQIFYACGAVFAGIAIRYIFKKMTLPMSIIIMTLVTAVLFFTLAFTKSVWILFTMLLLLGICNAGTRIQRTTYLFAHVPNQVYGRTTSIFFLFNIVFRVSLVSLFTIPFFQTGVGAAYAFGVLGLFLVISAGILIQYYPSFLNLKEN